MSPERPINADEPPPGPPRKPWRERSGEDRRMASSASSDPTEEAPRTPERRTVERRAAEPEKETPKKREKVAKEQAKEPEPQPIARRRQPRPLAPILLFGLVVVAIAFIAIAVIGGTGGSDEQGSGASPAPAPGVSSPSSDSGSAAAQTATELGFPVFATGNTTRVGGADPAANAAAVALAVFPSTTASQRPGAVTLIDEGNWAGAIAAAVLMAPPVRAPVLFSEDGSLPEATEQALAALQPAKTNRLHAGGAAGAAEVAALRDRLFPKPPEHIVIAPEDPELAMPAAAWAARSGDPVLFAGGDDLPAPTVAYLEKHNQAPIFVLGPSSAISSELVREAGKLGGPVSRVSGEDPVANAIALARYAKGGFGWDINDPGHGFVLVRSDAPLDAAAAAPLSASGTWGPLLLTDGAGTLPAELRDYFLDVKPGYTDNPTRAFYNHVWVIGDQEAIDLNQQAEVNELAELAKIGGGG